MSQKPVDTLPVVAWSILGGLWLVTAPGVLVAFGAVGDPLAGSRAGWIVAFLGWLSTPVTVMFALVARAGDHPPGTRAWLPLVSLAALPLGWLVGRVGIRLVRRR